MDPEQIDRYIIQEKLGQGGMASVYRAIDPRFERDVAIKVLPAEFMHDPTFRERFDREARLIAQLEHAAIVPVHDFGEVNGQPYLVMRYLPGGSLSERIKESGALPLDEIGSILQRIAAALDFAHGRGVIHRDVKPGNIVFDAEGAAYLSDFGLVRLAEDTSELTRSGMVGTPAYLAPEIADLSGTTPLIDVYALAVTLFQMLTGELPYLADTPMGLIVAHINKPVPLLSEHRPDLPEGLQTVIERGMAKDPDARYQTAGELAAEFDLAARGELPASAAAGLPARQPAGAGADPPSRSPIGLIIGIVGGIALLAAVIVLAGPRLGLTLGAVPTPTAFDPPPTGVPAEVPTVTPLPVTPTPEPATAEPPTATPVPPTATTIPTAAPGWVPIYEGGVMQLSQVGAGVQIEEIPQTVEGAFRLRFTFSFANPSSIDFTNGMSVDVRSGAAPTSADYDTWRVFFLSLLGTYRVGQLDPFGTYTAIKDHTAAPSLNPEVGAANEVVLTGQDEKLTLMINGEDVTVVNHAIDGLTHELLWRAYDDTTVDIYNVVLEVFE